MEIASAAPGGKAPFARGHLRSVQNALRVVPVIEKRVCACAEVHHAHPSRWHKEAHKEAKAEQRAAPVVQVVQLSMLAVAALVELAILLESSVLTSGRATPQQSLAVGTSAVALGEEVAVAPTVQQDRTRSLVEERVQTPCLLLCTPLAMFHSASLTQR